MHKSVCLVISWLNKKHHFQLISDYLSCFHERTIMSLSLWSQPAYSLHTNKYKNTKLNQIDTLMKRKLSSAGKRSLLSRSLVRVKPLSPSLTENLLLASTACLQLSRWYRKSYRRDIAHSPALVGLDKCKGVRDIRIIVARLTRFRP